MNQNLPKIYHKIVLLIRAIFIPFFMIQKFLNFSVIFTSFLQTDYLTPLRPVKIKSRGILTNNKHGLYPAQTNMLFLKSNILHSSQSRELVQTTDLWQPNNHKILETSESHKRYQFLNLCISRLAQKSNTNHIAAVFLLFTDVISLKTIQTQSIQPDKHICTILTFLSIYLLILQPKIPTDFIQVNLLF